MNEVAPLLTPQQEENGAGDFWVDQKNHEGNSPTDIRLQ